MDRKLSDFSDFMNAELESLDKAMREDMDKKMKQGKCEPKPTIPCEDIENETT